MTLLLSSMWLNFGPFPCIWLNFSSHRALQNKSGLLRFFLLSAGLSYIFLIIPSFLYLALPGLLSAIFLLSACLSYIFLLIPSFLYLALPCHSPIGSSLSYLSCTLATLTVHSSVYLSCINLSCFLSIFHNLKLNYLSLCFLYSLSSICLAFSVFIVLSYIQ